ncbi:DUF1453 domain-containing protein [Nakamurella endophytica]|uniref:DUF1453 domain-containing protein n=1 Tax=Nakamurella endophytica TaxID=1748367 RepID=A0A917WFB5_9ACTN|nr:DUF1453 domain-containing protein [Nakamurella endophytica]GGL98340.1 hypothetical protein GCM10011594_17810 [Nakamurella endophytica]
MSPLDLVAIVALVGYAVYKQTQVSEVTERGRFKLALIYGIVGLAVGGFNLPSGVGGWSMLAGSLALSVVIGLMRGHWTRMWRAADGRIFKQGTKLTVGLFIGMVVVKFGLGTVSHFTGIDDGEGFGEVMVMMALMIAVQAQLMWLRAQRMGAVPAARQQQYAVTR